MPLVALSMALVVLSGVLYHLSQKSIPGGIHPLFSLLVTYGVAIAVTMLLVPFFPLGRGSPSGASRVHWSSVAVGVSIVGVELGFLLAYRAGWRLSVGSAAGNAAVATLLVPTGILLFREKISPTNVIGVALCLAGLLLVVRR
jgi:drug/metabolite transporter (DMT)-like permease